MNRWKQINNDRWERSDNAIVSYDERANTMYAKPWSPHHRGWLAYSPVDEYPISYETKKGFKVPKKYKTAASAIKAIERLFPFKLNINGLGN